MLSYITTYGLMLLYFSLFCLAVKTTHESRGGNLSDMLAGKSEPGILFTRLMAGIFFLGISTAMLVAKRNFDFKIYNPFVGEGSWIWICVTGLAIAVGVIQGNKKIAAENSAHFLPPYLPLAYVAIRTLFLIIYEFFFRGAMLFVMTGDFGVTIAVIINLALYVLVHWYDKKERYGSVIIGGIFCWLTIYYHSVWPAIFVHVGLSLGYEITLILNNQSLIKKIRL